MSHDRMTIAVLGGTGKEGGGLALRWAHKGHRLIIGSRTAERAEEAAIALRDQLGRDAQISGMANADAAAAAELVVLSVPYAAQQSTAQDVATRKPVQLPNDESVTFAHVVECRLELRAITCCAARSFFKHEITVRSRGSDGGGLRFRGHSMATRLGCLGLILRQVALQRRLPSSEW